MDDEDFLNRDLVATLTVRFKAVRVIGQRLAPISWTVRAEVIYDDDVVEDEQAHYDFNVKVALSKIKFWCDSMVDGCVMFYRDNEWAQRAFLADDGTQSVENNFMLLPDEPDDEMLARIFQSKFNALGGNFLVFGEIDISSDDLMGLSYSYTGMGEFDLPPMEAWVGERSFFEKPWWSRDDVSIMDIIPSEDADLNQPPAFAQKLDFIATAMRPPKDLGARVIRPEFRPQVIQGGKND
jgi:hypothetical protein